MRILLVLMMACLAGCRLQPMPPNVVVEGATIRIEGTIRARTAQSFQEALAAGGITRVQLNSGGGEVEPSLAIARSIFATGLDVEVVGDCLSACANYLFPAGKNKLISGPGVVGWHGNIQHLVYLHETGERVMVEQTYQGMVETAQHEADFFAMIGVNPFVCWFGKVDPFNVKNFYFLTVADMERFGIRNVTARPDYADTDTDYMNRLFFISNLKLLEVDWAAYEAVPPVAKYTSLRD